LSVALSPDLSSGYHRIGKSQSRAISTAVNKLWKANLALKLLALEFVLARERSLCAPMDSRAAFQTRLTTLNT